MSINNPPRVLIACEYSGTVRDAFSAAGCIAWSCDLILSEKPGRHILGNAAAVLSYGWDLLIAHPPCQFLSYAANRVWWNPGREADRKLALDFFLLLLNAPVPRVCVENPVGLPNSICTESRQLIDPYNFGDPACKRTTLWLRNLPRLYIAPPSDLLGLGRECPKPAPVYTRRDGRRCYFTEAMKGHGAARRKARAKFFPGIAQAMAEQWSPLLFAAAR